MEKMFTKKASSAWKMLHNDIYSLLSYFHIYGVGSFTARLYVKINRVILANVVNQT